MSAYNNSGGMSNLQRKLARQRELDLMEAEASGIAPSMELHTVHLTDEQVAMTDGGGSFLRPRAISNTQSANEIERPTARPLTNANLWDRRDTPNQKINIMDAEAGVYKEPESVSARLGKMMSFTSSKPSHHNDASPAAETVDFVGDHPRKSSTRPSRTSPFYAAFRQTFCETRSRALMMMAAAIFVIFMTVFMFKTGSSYAAESQLRAEHNKRFNAMLDHIISTGASHNTDFLDYSSAEYHALRWLAYTDGAQLATDHPMVPTRYALAVFYYESYLTFEHGAGKQRPVYRPDDEYWEGVPNPGWKRKDYWLSSKGHCSWWGVTCQPEDNGNETHYDGHGALQGLNLNDNHVVGTVPKEFKALEQMKELELSNNNLHGSFPAPLGFNFRLEKLSLQHNRLDGTLVPQIGYLEGVREVDMSSNFMKGSIPTELNRLRNLQSISLANNHFTGAVPDLSDCRVLTSLQLNNNRLKGKFPSSLTKSTGLQEFFLNDNQFTGTLPSNLKSMTDLVSMHIENNEFSGNIPYQVFPLMVWLKEIHMQNNTFSGALPFDFGHAPLLKVVDVSSNTLSDHIPTTWESRGLEVLDFHNNKFGGPIPSALGDLHSLREIHFHNNELTGHIPSELGQCTSLEGLYLENNKLQGNVQTQLANLHRLDTLRIEHNDLHGQVLYVCDLKSESLSFFSADCFNDVQCSCCDECF